MKALLAGVFGRALLTLSFLALLLSFIPILYMLVLAIALSAMLPAFLCLLYYERKYSSRTLTLAHGFFPFQLLFDRLAYLSYYKGRTFYLRAFRALRLGVLAILLNLVLYGALFMHSQFVYINSLDRELDPYRKVLRHLSSEPTKPAAEPGSGK